MRSCKAHCATYGQAIAFGDSLKGMSRMAAPVAAPQPSASEAAAFLQYFKRG
jgi:hypothetical protein